MFFYPLPLPLPFQVSGPLEELEEVKQQLEEKERDLDDLTAALKEKDIRVKELEIELLTANQKQLAGDGEHAHEMREMAEKLDQCKVSSIFLCCETRGERKREMSNLIMFNW